MTAGSPSKREEAWSEQSLRVEETARGDQSRRKMR